MKEYEPASVTERAHITSGTRPERALMQEASPHPLRTSLWEQLTTVQTEKTYVPDRMRQQEIFRSIDWDTFREELFRETGDIRTMGAGKQLRGKLMELLIQADISFGERSALERELLDLAHNPDAYGLGKELGYHRNPDLAFLIVHRADGVVIEGVGESKLGRLNERSFRQLSEAGFTRGVHALVDVVNSLADPAAHGLAEIAKVQDSLAPGMRVLTIAPEFSQLLVIPANRNPGRLSTLLNYKDLPASSREPFRQLLTDPNRVTITRCAFSTAEIAALTEAAVAYESGRRGLSG